ncbi:Cell division protein FtsX [bacterium HR34]|nr:Cell division protein FtsX [bacterium HR34]
MKYFLKGARWGIKTFKRQKAIASANIFIFSIVLFLLTSLFLFQGVNKHIIEIIKDRVDISIYVKQEILPEDVEKIKENILAIQGIRKVDYISKEEVLEKFLEKHSSDEVVQEALKEVGENPFKSVFNIKADNLESYADIVLQIENIEDLKDKIDEIDFTAKKPVIEKISSFSEKINIGFISFIAIFIIIAILVTINQVKLSIATAKEEIEVMRLIGASNWFIRSAFIAQAVFAVIISTLITLSIISVLLFIFNDSLKSILSGFSLMDYFIDNIFLIISINLLVSIIISTLTSLISLGKYLKI